MHSQNKLTFIDNQLFKTLIINSFSDIHLLETLYDNKFISTLYLEI